MPGPKTHEIFYRQLKKLLPAEMTERLPNYDAYSLYAQGHDLLIYRNWWMPWQLNRNIGESLLLQEHSFQSFICAYMAEADRRGFLRSEQLRLFLSGYIQHHILDSCMHPLIIYHSGDHTRDSKNKTW